MLIYPTPQDIVAFTTTRNCNVLIDIKRIIIPYHQAHSTKTIIINDDFLNKNALEQAIALTDVDALSTNLPNICVCIKTADCIPILLWDDTTKVISAVHAGWKGTLQRIVEANIEVLKKTYATQSENLHAIIGPGISLESFEIGDEVYETFFRAGFPLNQLAKRYPSMHKSDHTHQTKWHFDLIECNRLQLINQGVSPSNIHISHIDTYNNYHNYYSVRRGLEGRNINGIIRVNKTNIDT